MSGRGARRWGSAFAWAAAFVGAAGCQVLFGVELPDQGDVGAGSGGSTAGTGPTPGEGGRTSASGSGGSGTSGSGAGASGAGSSSGGAAGAAGSGGAGGAPGPVALNVLGCSIWLPSNPAWGVAGDARVEPGRIVLTPPDASPRQRWGQAYLPFLIDPQDELEVAFTFALEPGGAGDDFDLGAALWFATPSDPFPPVGQTFDLTLGVPPVDAGLALALDLRPTAPGGAGPAWGLYLNPFFDNRSLGGFVGDGIIEASSPLAAGAPGAGPHTTLVQLRRVSQLDTDDVDVGVTFVAPAGAPAIATSFADGEDELLDRGYLGFSAGSAEGAGAAHALLGVEIKVDGACRDAPE